MSDYEDILNQGRDQIPEPQLLPVGSWRLKNTGWSIIEAKDAGKNDCVLFIYSATEPMQDVDEEALAALGDYDVATNKIFFRIWLETYSDWDKVVKHIDKHNSVAVEGEKVKDMLNRIKGSVVIAWLDQRSYEKNGEMVDSNDPTNFSPVED